ncbi:hypothetical protein ACOALZ_12940 [Nocardiopsis algeriensis]|uniref:hypothetical protein n=1 Tax=Nocardiopsis algeriensis TaxID=1478215 RepID=UPI003B43AD03
MKFDSSKYRLKWGMQKQSALKYFHWIGVKRVVPVFLGILFPGVREFFSDVEEARIQGREGGEMDLNETLNLCILDGTFSLGYTIIISLPGMALCYVLFEVFDMAGGGLYADLLVLAGLTFMTTAAVEFIDSMKIYLLSLLVGESYIPRLIGPVSYSFLFLSSFLLMFWFFFV